MPKTRNWLRAGILVATLLPLISIAVIASFSQAQPPRIPPPGGMPRTNPGMPGGNPNFPNNPSMPGGNPNFPNGPGPSMPNMPGPRETVWICDNCKKEVGRGPIKPNIANCPFCGVRLDTMAGMQADNQDRMNDMMNRNSRPPFASGPSGPPSSPAGGSSAPRVAAAFWIVALIVLAVIVVIIAVAIGGAVMLFNTTPRPRRVSRSRRYRDDY